MPDNYILHSCVWCPVEDVKEYIKKNRELLKEMIEHNREYGDNEGVTFLELTEDALRNLSPFMVRHMKCFTRENIDTMVFNIKEVKLNGKYVENIINYLEECLPKLCKSGFSSEILIMKEIKIEEENAGKTIRKKDYEVHYHSRF